MNEIKKRKKLSLASAIAAIAITVGTLWYASDSIIPLTEIDRMPTPDYGETMNLVYLVQDIMYIVVALGILGILFLALLSVMKWRREH
ncbi:hypothetical protein [Methanonatronarchaeum sp. AMET-Sl]|uniref:hypothetical protein n=1 Tax=Methanonatronarchaeum sp. AMET-Sl TaxID=3037654 RepID=UPI00244DA635|nr:hypothetical protein [Methanonatronarchaeum sp. AMET-Sl]WGI16827.1 hypothetical protein QEN48_04850 [Methanonatronarchaeum sp. AMET-Sl]